MTKAEEGRLQTRLSVELQQRADIHENNPYADLLKLKNLNTHEISNPNSKMGGMPSPRGSVDRMIASRQEPDPSLDPNEVFYAANEKLLQKFITPKPPARTAPQTDPLATKDPQARIPGITVEQYLLEAAQEVQRQDDIATFADLAARLKGDKPLPRPLSKPQHPSFKFSPQMLKDFALEEKMQKSKKNPNKKNPKKKNPKKKTLQPLQKPNLMETTPIEHSIMIDPHIPRMAWNEDSWVSEISDEEYEKSLYGDYGVDPVKDQLRDILRARRLGKSGLVKSVVLKPKSLGDSFIRMGGFEG
jgi:hypothetical protein